MRRFLPLLLVVGGCIGYTPRPLDPVKSAQAISARRLDDPAVHAYVEKSLGRTVSPWPPQRWDLDTLTAAALFFNPDVAIARAEHATAMAAIVTARQMPNPTASASIEHKAPTVESSPWVSSFGFDLPLELPAKRRARVDQARANAEALRSRVTVVAWNVRSTLRQRVLEVWAAAQRQGVLRRQQTIERDIVEIFDKRLQLGEAAQPELARARIALVQTDMLVQDAVRFADEARAGIAAAVGVPLQSPAFLPVDIDAIRYPDMSSLDDRTAAAIAGGPDARLTTDELREAALTGRADVLAALHDYAAAEAALRLEVARQYPDLHLGPALGWDQGARTWALAASAELPLLNRHRGEIGEAVARRDEAAARFNAVQSSIVAALGLAETQLLAARRKLEVAEKQVQSEDAQVAAAQRQFDAGEIDRLALRSTELERETAALARVDAAMDVQRALGAIEDALQRPLTPILRLEGTTR